MNAQVLEAIHAPTEDGENEMLRRRVEELEAELDAVRCRPLIESSTS